MFCCLPQKNNEKNIYPKQVIRDQVENIYIKEDEEIKEEEIKEEDIKEEEIKDEGIEEEEIKEEIIEDEETQLCLKCSKILRLNELYSIEIEKIPINVCKKCSELSKIELNNWYTDTCVKNIKDFILTIKFKSKNYIFVKYQDEDINKSINRFIRLIGINNEKINKKINKLIKNKLLKK